MISHSDHADKAEYVQSVGRDGEGRLTVKTVYTSDNITVSLSELNIIGKLLAGPFAILGSRGRVDRRDSGGSPTISVDEDGELRCWPLGLDEDISFKPTLMYRIMERLDQHSGIPF